MKTLILSVLAALLLSVSGCETLQEHEFSARLATQYATIKIVDEDPAKAERVVSIATEIQRYAGAETFLTVDLLIGAIRDRVPWQRLDAADELLVNALLDQLRTELVARLGPDALPQDVRLAVDTVSRWVIEAARMI